MSQSNPDDHFSSLCNMAECLEKELAEINTVRDYCGRCK